VAYEVLRVASVGRTVQGMTRRERRAYDAAVQALRGEGCRAGGKRLMASAGDEYPLCQRALYGAWRMTTAYRTDGSIVIVALAKHAEDEDPAATLSEIFPGLSARGRRRSEQPLCCEDPAAPPTMSPELERILFEVFGA
jgi:hypothetical protein